LVKNVEDLYVSALDVAGHDADWAQIAEAQDFDFFWDAKDCDGCGEIVESRERSCQNEECENYGREVDSFEGPMMNYWYDLPISDESEAVKIAVAIKDTSLCVVEVDGSFGLALTGGGMDLSWEICEAYMLAGYLPPVHFAGGLPEMANIQASAKNAWLLAGCQRSLSVQIDFLKARQEHLDRLSQKLGFSEPAGVDL
jgi:hypothetical protein